MKYPMETRIKALASIEEIGLGATAEKMHINRLTLSKWKKEAAPANNPDPAKDAQEVLALIAQDESLTQRIQELEAENGKLHGQIADISAAHQQEVNQYRARIAALTNALKALLD